MVKGQNVKRKTQNGKTKPRISKNVTLIPKTCCKCRMHESPYIYSRYIYIFSNQTTMCSIKYTKPIRKKIPDSTPDLANKLFSRDGCNKSPMTIFFFFLLWAPSETKNLSTPVALSEELRSLSFRLSGLWLKWGQNS